MPGRCDRILLIGMMGAGKTTVGNAVATLLGWRYYDNDDLVRTVAGVDARALLETAGPHSLRRAEAAALTLALSEGGPLVAGVAAGTVTDPLDLKRLRAGGFGGLAARESGDVVGPGGWHRPTLARLSAGARVADVVVRTGVSVPRSQRPDDRHRDRDRGARGPSDRRG